MPSKSLRGFNSFQSTSPQRVTVRGRLLPEDIVVTPLSQVPAVEHNECGEVIWEKVARSRAVV